MNQQTVEDWSDLAGKVAVVTGGTGVLLSPAMSALNQHGVKLVLLGIDQSKFDILLGNLQTERSEATFMHADVTDLEQIRTASEQVMAQYGRVDILINGAGGNQPQATTSPQLSFFDLPKDAVEHVFDLNFTGAFFCCQVFGKIMAEQKNGNIINILSMNAIRPLTRIPAYSSAKAAMLNFTQWLAVHMAQEYSPSIRVNAIAPGFFLTDQNRFLLIDHQTGELTVRGKRILEHTPAGRFGDPEDLVGALLWLLSKGSTFVNGVVLPVDGGFSAYGGV